MTRSTVLLAAVCGTIVLTSFAPNSLAQDAVAIRAGHNVLEEVDHRPTLAVGAAVGALSFKDLEGKAHYLDDLCKKGLAVLNDGWHGSAQLTRDSARRNTGQLR